MLMDNPVGNSQRNKEKAMLNSQKDVWLQAAIMENLQMINRAILESKCSF